MSEPSTHLVPGSLVDGFRLEERIHQGSMSALWVVKGPEVERSLIMKIPSLREGDDPAAIVSFEVEQMILPTLSGVHVPRFVASGDFAAQPYIVMERIPGDSLRKRLAQAPLPSSEVASIGARVAAALQDIHGQHVIHFDVKPSSVMFRENGDAVLVDFGLARREGLPDLLAEEFRIPIGTGPYISPEQVLRIRKDPRSDLFALGALLYFLATGHRPFGNPSTLLGVRRRLYRDPKPPRALNPKCPAWLQDVVLRCLEVDPRRRFATAGELARLLEFPDRIERTERADRIRRDSIGVVVRRWWGIRRAFRSVGNSHASDMSPLRRPIVMVALDTTCSAALAGALGTAAERTIRTEPRGRLACVTVLRTSRIAMDSTLDEQGRNVHLRLLGELRRWARPLGFGGDRITFHVLEAPDLASTILDFAHANEVDHILIGARGSSTLRRYLGSVSSEVVARAECTVTVVRSGGRPVSPAVSLLNEEATLHEEATGTGSRNWVNTPRASV